MQKKSPSTAEYFNKNVFSRCVWTLCSWGHVLVEPMEDCYTDVHQCGGPRVLFVSIVIYGLSLAHRVETHCWRCTRRAMAVRWWECCLHRQLQQVLWHVSIPTLQVCLGLFSYSIDSGAIRCKISGHCLLSIDQSCMFMFLLVMHLYSCVMADNVLHHSGMYVFVAYLHGETTHCVQPIRHDSLASECVENVMLQTSTYYKGFKIVKVRSCRFCGHEVAGYLVPVAELLVLVVVLQTRSCSNLKGKNQQKPDFIRTA